jgi:hypothetical protein
MPTNRFNYSDDFVLNNGKVGINSSSPQEKLDVVGITKAENLSVVGVSSLTGYEGFLRANHNIVESTSLEGGQGTTGSLSGEIVIGTGVTVTGVTTATSGQGYIDSLKVYNTFTVPVGGTTERPTKAKPGQLYYNEDFKTIEFYDGDRWRQVDNTTQRGRGVFGGGGNPAKRTEISYITLSTLGNAQNFGTLTEARETTACSSSKRGLFMGGEAASNSNVIDYVTISSEGNAIDFGDLTLARGGGNSACSSSTRGICGGGRTPTAVNTIDYVSIETLGNALDFGDLTISKTWSASCSSSVRGVWGGGGPVPTAYSIIDYITISSTGNAVTFGNLTETKQSLGSCANSTRGIFAAGYTPAAVNVDTIEFITLSSTGNAQDFGNLSATKRTSSCCASQIIGIIAAGESFMNTIEYVTISTAGNAQDFGDLTIIVAAIGALSDSHGGLGGF